MLIDFHRPKTEDQHPGTLDGVLEVVGSKKKILEAAIADIDGQLTGRRELHGGLTAQLEQRVTHLEALVKDLPPFNPGSEPAYLTRRTTLERERSELEREMRNEQVAFWRDQTRLQEERRKMEREVRTLELGIGILPPEEM